VRMFHALRNHALQELPGVQAIRDGVVEEYDATCLIPPGGTASLDRFGNIVIDL